MRAYDRQTRPPCPRAHRRPPHPHHLYKYIGRTERNIVCIEVGLCLAHRQHLQQGLAQWGRGLVAHHKVGRPESSMVARRRTGACLQQCLHEPVACLFVLDLTRYMERCISIEPVLRIHVDFFLENRIQNTSGNHLARIVQRRVTHTVGIIDIIRDRRLRMQDRIQQIQIVRTSGMNKDLVCG